jgi:hypothetical protein
MPQPFTIRIFVPDGNPDGVRIIDRMNWTGLGITFPRNQWTTTKRRPEFDRAGVYILVGYEEDDDLPTLYIGQADGLRRRIDNHYQEREFWDWGIAFVSTNHGLNRAHITWLEHDLIKRAQCAARSRLANSVNPQEPVLSESEKADTEGFLKEILQILPLVGLRAFEPPKSISDPDNTQGEQITQAGLRTDKDTVIVPAQKDGFERVFLGENAWYAIRISGGMLPRIKWIAAYQTNPISAVTHVAEVDHIEPYGESGKYKLVFKGPARKLENIIPFGSAPSGAMQGPRYTTYNKLLTATNISDLIT